MANLDINFEIAKVFRLFSCKKIKAYLQYVYVAKNA